MILILLLPTFFQQQKFTMVNQIIIALRSNMRPKRSERKAHRSHFRIFGVVFDFFRKYKKNTNWHWIPFFDQSQILLISFISLSLSLFPSFTQTLLYKCTHTTEKKRFCIWHTRTQIWIMNVCICIECDSVPPPLPPPVKGAYYYNNDHPDLGEWKLKTIDSSTISNFLLKHNII